MYHSTCSFPQGVFTIKTCPTCWHENCNAKSVGVGVVNFWGSVYPVVMCEEHTRVHGNLLEYDPFRNRPERWRQILDEYSAKEKTK